jgi:hypothetical protein
MEGRTFGNKRQIGVLLGTGEGKNCRRNSKIGKKAKKVDCTCGRKHSPVLGFVLSAEIVDSFPVDSDQRNSIVSLDYGQISGA